MKLDRHTLENRFINMVATMEKSREAAEALSQQFFGLIEEAESMNHPGTTRPLTYIRIDHIMVMHYINEIDEILDHYRMLRDGIKP